MIKTLLSSLVFVLSYSSIAHAKLNIEAISNNTIEVPEKEYRSVSYKVSNPESITQSFILKDIPGVIVESDDANNCHVQSKLKAQQSCILKLKLPAKSIDHMGPTLCDLDLKHCNQPKFNERLTVATLPEGTPTVSISIGAIKQKKPHNIINFKAKRCNHSFKRKNRFGADEIVIDQDCNIEFFSDVTAFYGSIGIVNTSTVPIYFTPPTSPYLDSTPDEFSCTNYTTSQQALAPGEICFFYYQGTGSTGGPVPQSFKVYPVSNFFNAYYLVNYTIQLFDIGNYYPDSNGQQIFQLPTESDTRPGIYIMYTAAGSDESATDQDSAIEICLNQGMVLPNSTVLETLQSVSNCGSNIISGFNCGSWYWSSTPEPDTAVNFADGQPGTPPTDSNLSRCATRWLFKAF